MFEHTASLLGRLNGVVKSSNGWEAHCPCRDDDQNPSLSVHEKDDGQVLLFCHRNGGCDAERVCQSLGIETSALRPPKPREVDEVSYPKQEPAKLKFVEAYDFLDVDGKLLFQKIRYVDEVTGRKTFRQRRSDGRGGWDYKLGDTPKILYNLPAVVKAKAENETIFVVEGEKDANTLIRLGAVATTMPGGAGKWLDIHTQALAGATVDIIADNDAPGLAHAALVYDELKKAGCDVCIWKCPSAKDITDHVAQGGTTEQLVEITRNAIGSNEQEFVEVVEVEDPPMSAADVLISKMRALLGDPSKPPEQVISRIKLLASSEDGGSEVDAGRLVVWDDFVREEESDTYDWVIPGLLERSERVIVVAVEGVGKRADVSSLIPTPDGWVKLGDIKVGDKVFDRFGSPVAVTYVSPVEPNPDAYRVTFSDGNVVDADAEHQWYTESLRERETRSLGKVRTTAEIRDTLVSARQSCAKNHAVPVTLPLLLPEVDLPVPPYTLGAWLGDGLSAHGAICSEDEEILDNIRLDGYAVRHNPSTKNIYGILGLRKQLRLAGLLSDKHIPMQYTRASFDQRLALVQGLMDTDGTVDRRGTCEFSVVNKTLAEGVLDLLLTLGIKATLREGAAKLDGRYISQRYRISFRTDVPVFRLSRKKDRLPTKLPTQRANYRYIVSVEKIDPVPMLCISVDGPDNTYLIGEAYIPTHNTMLARQMAILPALGVHPFTFQRIQKVRTLTVDLENPERIIRRSSKSIVAAARSMGFEKTADAHLLMKPDGLNLLSPDDRLLLEERVDEVKPDMLVLGPLYKSYIDTGTRNSEAIAVDVAKFLDSIRTNYKCCLWLEHHAPLGSSISTRDLRPFGSAVWSRWPEFGITLQPDPTSVGEYVYNVGRFRGDRDIRQWPKVMKRGKKFPFETLEF